MHVNMLHRGAADYYLAKRTYKGLEAPSMGAPAKEASLVIPGRRGRAAAYEGEPENPLVPDPLHDS